MFSRPHSLFLSRVADFHLGRHAVGVLAVVQWAGLFARSSSELLISDSRSKSLCFKHFRKLALVFHCGLRAASSRAEARKTSRGKSHTIIAVQPSRKGELCGLLELR